MEEFSPYEISVLDSILSGDKSANSSHFWDSAHLSQWLSHKGYTLYEPYIDPETQRRTSFARPRLPFEDFSESAYPYAYHNARAIKGQHGFGPSLHAPMISAYVVYAQDSQRRHVAIKLTRIGSEEYRILRFLNQQAAKTLRESCVLPIIDLLYLKNACFAVMPRWGDAIYEPYGNHTLRDILRIMQSMLKGLVFLHSHNIIHRDLKIDNVVINHFGNGLAHLYYYRTRMDLLHKGLLSYALIDYNVSIMLSPDVNRAECRLPCKESYIGSPRCCSDTLQGEFDYNPFAFDVGSMGVQFSMRYQRYTVDIPMLAPFLDRMVTRDVNKRFTAERALQFLEEKVIASSTQEQLATIERPLDHSIKNDWEHYDRWEGLPKDFRTQWAAYRNPIGVPAVWQVLRSIIQSEWLPPMFIPQTRLFFHRLTYSVPRFLWNQFKGLVGFSSPRYPLK